MRSLTGPTILIRRMAIAAVLWGWRLLHLLRGNSKQQGEAKEYGPGYNRAVEEVDCIRTVGGVVAAAGIHYMPGVLWSPHESVSERCRETLYPWKEVGDERWEMGDERRDLGDGRVSYGG